MRILTLKFYILVITMGLQTISWKSLAADSLFSCAPQGGQQSSDYTYVTYTLDKNGSDNDSTMSFRKTIVGPGDESTLEKTAYSAAFIYKEKEKGFEFGYMVEEDLFFMSGEFFSQPRSPEILVKALIFLEFNNTAKLFQGLMEAPEDIESWQCHVNIDEMRKFKIEDEEGLQDLKKIKIHFIDSFLTKFN